MFYFCLSLILIIFDQISKILTVLFLDEYESLRNFGDELLQTELSDDKKYAYMLIKTLGIVEKSLKEETEQSLEKYYYKSGRAR